MPLNEQVMLFNARSFDILQLSCKQNFGHVASFLKGGVTLDKQKKKNNNKTNKNKEIAISQKH